MNKKVKTAVDLVNAVGKKRKIKSQMKYVTN